MCYTYSGCYSILPLQVSYHYRIKALLLNQFKPHPCIILLTVPKRYFFLSCFSVLFVIVSVSVLPSPFCAQVILISLKVAIVWERKVKVMWRSHQPRFHPDLNGGLYRERVGMVISAPIRFYHVLMSILTIGLIVEHFFGCQKFFPD